MYIRIVKRVCVQTVAFYGQMGYYEITAIKTWYIKINTKIYNSFHDNKSFHHETYNTS
jgi:hypothetical protein